MRKSILLGGSLFAVALASAGAAAAQEAVGEEEIVVTARRTEESVQSVPVTVQAFSNALLRENSIANINDVQFNTPGVFLQGSASPQNSAYFIRGQGLSIAGFGLPGVITYISEVPVPAYGANNPQYDMQSLQVLKGPQGTLFGRNTMGGAVLLQPRTPTYEYGGYVQGALGDYDLQDFEAAVNIPLVDNVAALRVAAHSVRRDGYTENIGIGGDLDDLHTDDARIALLVEPNSWLSNTLTVDWSSTDSLGGSQIYYQTNAPVAAAFGLQAVFDAFTAQQQALGPFVTETNFEPILDYETLGVTNRTVAEFGNGLTLTNIFGFRRSENVSRNSIDGLGDTGLGTGIPGFGSLLDGYRFFEYEQFTDEVQLRGEHGAFQWLLGAFYLNNEPSGPTGSQNTIFGAPANASYRFYSEESRALYGNIRTDLSSWVDGLSFNLGLRQTWDEVSVCDGPASTTTNFSVSEDQCNAAVTTPDPAFGPASTNSAEFDGMSWTIGLDWQVNDDLFLYATSRRGYRSGGINSPRFDQNPANPLLNYQTFEPDTVTDIEIGVRSDYDIAGMRTRMNLSIFHALTEDAQRALTGLRTTDGLGTPIDCSTFGPVFGLNTFDTNCDVDDDPFDTGLIVNYGDASIDGIEADFTIWPVDGLSLNVAGTVQGTSTEEISANLAPLVPALASLGFNPEEVPFDATPSASVTSGVRWELPLNPDYGTVIFNADYYWVAETQLVAVELPSYDVTNVRLDWNGIFGSRVDASIFARNVFDQEYIVSTANPTAISPYFTVNYGPPRIAGVQLRYSWGAE